jgi:cell division protein ZapA
MSNVNLTIGGRPFTVACAAGEEEHVTALGQVIDAKLSSMEPLTGHNEVRMLLFAALLLADELHETRQRPAPKSAPELPAGLAKRLDTIAGQMENLAMRLEAEAGSA